ncbi:hypothetical protein NM688_g2235 [Phlebia brevispora]|uniref:Uncharacterized protein n=1 Tax=Phlebia brevispora TaxID=194682 RepID=A0ACC1T932_9APHY|nr:hypothetical protein NM688_g2235 [Phlebia brevispora]
MTRRIASQVHKQASRLLRAQYLRKEPAWYQAVLEHPPLPLPAKAPPLRTSYDLPPNNRFTAPPSKHMHPHEPRPMPVYYVEDDVRRQFFLDHPFEAFRPRTLLEGEEIEPEHPINGAEWTRLRQRGRNPSSEDCIKYIVNLHNAHGVSLTEAYASGIAQFRSLRAEHQVAANVALAEAESNGIVFGPSEVEKNFKVEEWALQGWSKKHEQDAAAQVARKRWHAVVEAKGAWTGAREYTRLWQEGVRPSYSTAIEQSVTGSRSQ